MAARMTMKTIARTTVFTVVVPQLTIVDATLRPLRANDNKRLLAAWALGNHEPGRPQIWVVPDAFPAKAGVLVGTHGSLVFDRGNDANGHGERGGENRILQQPQSRRPYAPHSVLLRSNEQVEVPGARLEILRQLLAPHRGVNRVRIADCAATGLDDAAKSVLRIECNVDLRLGRCTRTPPGFYVGARQPAADEIPIHAVRRAQVNGAAMLHCHADWSLG